MKCDAAWAKLGTDRSPPRWRQIWRREVGLHCPLRRLLIAVVTSQLNTELKRLRKQAGLAVAVGSWTVMLGCWVGSAIACDTPVYRYALYNWSTSPYVLYRFQADAPAAADSANKTDDTEGATAGAPAAPQANFIEIAVGQGDPAQLELVPETVLRTWREQGSAVPLDVLLGPQGAVLFAGQVTASDLLAIAESPARQEVVRQLGTGQPSVLLVLTGANATANEAALAAVDETIARGGAGKIEPAKLGTDPAAAPAEPPSVALGRVVISVADEREMWLVRMLAHVEPDLAEFDGQPMVFAVYGRGRAMEPYIGEGITADNISECVSFILGSCSCQVKDRNPGVDLLTRWDWDSTALAVAQQVGQEEGNEALLDAADTRILSQVVAGPGSAAPPSANPDSPAAANPDDQDPTATTTDDEVPAPRIRVALQASEPPASSTTAASHTTAESTFADQMGLRIAAAVLVVLAVAAAGTMVLLRTRMARRAS